MKEATQRFGIFSLLFTELFLFAWCRVFKVAQSQEESFFTSHSDHCHFLFNERVAELRKEDISWSTGRVVYTVRQNMIVDAICHVNTLQRGLLKHIWLDCDGSCGWAIMLHNSIYKPTNMITYLKYSNWHFKLPQLPDLSKSIILKYAVT